MSSRRVVAWEWDGAARDVPQPMRLPRAQPRARSLSCVIPCFNEAPNLQQLLPQLREMLRATHLRWEVIVVDDGSTDDTEGVAAQWSEMPGFRFIALSRNFGKEAAITAGLAAATGDAVVLLDGDMQHSPDLVRAMVDHWLAGAEVVYAVRVDRRDEGRLKKLGTHLFYKLLNASNRVNVPENAGDFRLMDRKVVNVLTGLPERSRFMKGLYAWVGFRAVALPYTPAPRAQGCSSFNGRRLVKLALDGLTAFTTWPLHLMGLVGLMLALPALSYGAYVVVDHMLFGNEVSGWATIVAGMMFFIGMQMISIGIVGQYVARIYEEVKGRPVYVIREQRGVGLEADSA